MITKQNKTNGSRKALRRFKHLNQILLMKDHLSRTYFCSSMVHRFWVHSSKRHEKAFVVISSSALENVVNFVHCWEKLLALITGGNFSDFCWRGK